VAADPNRVYLHFVGDADDQTGIFPNDNATNYPSNFFNIPKRSLTSDPAVFFEVTLDSHGPLVQMAWNGICSVNTVVNVVSITLVSWPTAAEVGELGSRPIKVPACPPRTIVVAGPGNSQKEG
jgi:hypothetical protein